MANQRGRGRGAHRAATRDNRKNVPPEETQPSSRMECDDTTPNADPDAAETSELQGIMSLLESAANSEVQEDQSTEVQQNFQLAFKLLVPLLRSHLRRTAPAAPDKFELKAAIVDERRSRTVVFKNVQESTKAAAVVRASDDLTAVNEVLNYLNIAAKISLNR
ncbi:hypothetical protein AAVH_21383 [Aphelenchoides avenae]|nr:hypothetical protein AAVH_21383 [Aphelenchus avenae]